MKQLHISRGNRLAMIETRPSPPVHGITKFRWRNIPLPIPSTKSPTMAFDWIYETYNKAIDDAIFDMNNFNTPWEERRTAALSAVQLMNLMGDEASRRGNAEYSRTIADHRNVHIARYPQYYGAYNNTNIDAGLRNAPGTTTPFYSLSQSIDCFFFSHGDLPSPFLWYDIVFPHSGPE